MAPRPELTRLVRNQSSRNGQKPRLIVLHSTESHNRPGLSDLTSLAGWFDNPSAQASSHVANDAEGNDARYVIDERKAWTCAYYNSISLNIEQIGFAAQGSWSEAQVKNTAEWVAYWSKKYGIPLIESTTLGVCRHSDLGVKGGGHHDPGANFPVSRMLELARKIDPKAQKQKRWTRNLAIARSELKSLLAARARMRQRKLEKSAGYSASTARLYALRTRITRLKQLVRR